MMKLGKFGLAVALGLMLSLSLFTSGVFAQSVDHSNAGVTTTTGTTVATTSVRTAGQILQVAQAHQTSQAHSVCRGYCGYGGRGRFRRVYYRCFWVYRRAGFRWIRSTRVCRPFRI